VENPIEVIDTYGVEHAKKVIEASQEDYKTEFEIE